MATRIQVRRGTTSEWNTADPILNSGEIGYNSTLGQIKVGDGESLWSELDYIISASSLNTSLGSYILDSEKSAANGVAELDGSKNILAPAGIIFEGTADAYETTLVVTDPTDDRTITFPNASGTVVLSDNSGNVSVSGNLTVSGTTTTINSTEVNVQNAFIFEGTTADAFETTLTVTDPTADRTITLPDATGTVALTSNIPSTTDGLSEGSTNKYFTDERAQDATAAALANGTHTNITITYNDGSNAISLAAAPGYTNEEAQDAVGNSLGTGLSYNDTTGAISVDTATIQARVANVSDTEIGYLDGVTSAIQTQINSKAPTDSPTFTGTVTLPTGTVTSTMIADGTIVNADINASAAIALSKLATNPLARANHTGTQTASTISDFDTQVSTSKITDLTAPTSSFSMNSQKITNLADPNADQDAATKAYVDAATAGLNVHASVKAATTANITLATDVENGDTLDGVVLATGNRILIKNQTTQSQNGVYIVSATGAPTRATDYDSTPEVDAGDFIFVEGGTVNGKTGWVQTNAITTIGTDSIAFTQFSGAGTYAAGNGLTLTGSTFSINTGVTVDLNTSQTLTNKTISGANNTISNINLASQVTGTLPVANGGTGITSLGAGIATFLGTPSSANLISAITDETGTGSLVFATSPTLVTPTLGVATATSINGTTIPTSATLTKTTDKLSVFAATTSTELLGVISDETGSGSLVFATSPTLSLPSINNLLVGYTTTATAAGTTTLTASSNYKQYFTGTTTQTIVLPVASTMALGQTFFIENNSTGNLTVNSSGGNLVVTVIPGSIVLITCILTSGTTAASWDVDFDGFTSITGTGSVVLSTSPTLTTPAITTALTLNATGELRLADTDSSHYVGFKAPGTVSTNRIWTLPSADGTTGQVLQTNGSGTLSFSTPAAGAAFSEFMLIGA